MEDKTLTDEIYAELVDGLKTGLDWPHFLAKHSASKGPLYNAIGRFLSAIEPKVRALGEVQAKLDQRGLELDSLDQKIKEAESSLTPLENRRNVLNEQIETLETKLDEKNEIIKQIIEMEKLGFNIERLRELKGALTEIGAKHGLKGKEAVSKFFDDLKDYEAVLGAGSLLQGLQTQIETKKLEAEKWQAETEKVERQYKELQEATSVMQALLKRGVKAEQIVSWNKSLTSIGGVEELEKGLSHYSSILKLLAAKKREGKRLDTSAAKLNGQVNTLKEQKAEIEGSIKALRASAIAEIESLGQAGLETLRAQKAETEGLIKTLKTSALNEIKETSQTGVAKIAEVAQVGSNSLRQVGETASSELKQALSLVDEVSARAIEVGKIVGQVEEKLSKSKEITEKTTTLVAGIEAGR